MLRRSYVYIINTKERVMKKILIPLCLLIMSEVAYSQRSHQFDTSNRLFNEGKEFFWLKNYSGCIDKLEAFKQKATDADLIQEADYMLVCSAYEQGRPKAEELLKDYLETYPDSRHSDEIDFLIGSVHFGRQEYQKAIYWFNEANIDMLSPEQQETYSFRLAYSLLQTGDKEKARGYFARIAQVGKTYKEAASYYVAYIDYATGQYNNALIEFTRLKENPEFKEQSLYYIAQIYFIQNKFEKVTSEGESLLSTYPGSKNNTEIYRILGNSYYQLGDENKAISRLSKYYTMTEHPLRSDLYILGVCYYNKGEYNNAVKMLGQTVKENDALSQNAYLYLGQSYLKLKDKNNARMAFETASSASYDKQVKEAAMYNYALLIHETNFTGFGESVTVFENFLNEFPNSKYADKVNDYLVEVYMTTKNYSAALNSINKIKQPSQKILVAKQDILFQLGTQAFTNMKTDEAIKLFNQSIALGEYDPEARSNAYFWRGESYYRLQEFENAISDYRTYLNNTRQRSTDTYALAHYNLGYSYFKQKDYPTALSSFRKYTELETNKQAAALADAYNRIGDCLYQSRQFTEANENYTRAEQLQPSAGDYSLYQKGFLLGLQKDYAGKVKSLDRLIQDYPQSQYVDDALFEKGRTYLLMDNNSAAAQAFEKLTREFPQSSNARKAGVQLALIYFNNNQLEKAADAYKKVISEYPGSDEAKTALQDLKSVYIELNDINSYANYVNTLGGSVRLETSEQDSLTYMAAEKLFMRGDNEGAQRSLTKYLQSFPNGSFSSNANYYLGSIAFNNKDYKEAENHFRAVIKSGDTKFMEEAVARTAEIQYLNKDFTSAEQSFKQLQAIAEKPENKQAARLGILRCAQQNGKSKDALFAADELLKESKLSPEVSVEARLARAKAYIDLKQESKALADLKELSKDTRTVQGAEAKYLLAQLYYNSKDDKNAEKVLMNFIEDGTPHQYWLARGFILLADVYIRQGDDFQARQYLTSLKNNYKAEDEIQGMIEDRLAKLKK
jgi:TolA-binding protein